VWDPHLCKNLLNHGMSNTTMDHLGNSIWTLYAYWKVLSDIWFTNCLFFQIKLSHHVLSLFTLPHLLYSQSHFTCLFKRNL